MQHKLFYIPARNKIGAIIRTTDSSERFELIKSAVDRLLNLNEISLIYIMIYKPDDNSGLRKKLIEKYGKEKKRIMFFNIASGNFFSDILNYAISEQTRHGIDYSLVISPEAFEYINRENFDRIINSIKDGSLAVSLKINEYSKIIDEGYFSNAFAIYRNTVANFVDIWNLQSVLTNLNKDETHFGIEELYTIKYLIDTYGRGSVNIIKNAKGKMTYLDDKNSKEWQEKVTKTKIERVKKMQEILKIVPEEFIKMIIWS